MKGSFAAEIARENRRAVRACKKSGFADDSRPFPPTIRNAASKKE